MKNRGIALMVTLAAILPVLSGIGLAQDNSRPLDRALIGDELAENVISNVDKGNLVLNSPGEVVGYTEYEYQTNGSTGNRCALDSDGCVHVVWTKGVEYPTQREVYYNFMTSEGDWLIPGEGQPISDVNGDGYIQLDLAIDNRAAVAYHENTYYYVTFAIDAIPGFGIFFHMDPPDMLDYRCYWPYIAIDRTDRIHLVMRENSPLNQPGTIGYTRSADEGNSWSTLSPVDTIFTYSQSITASPVSNKVAIIYAHPTDLEIQWMNDVYYIESENGTYWDWQNGKVNVTEYGTEGDSLYAYTDVAAIYDYDDNLHIIWNAWYATENHMIPDTAFLYHYDYGTGIISLANAREFDPDYDCVAGAWSMAIAKMSLGVHEPSGGVFAAYTVFDASDCSDGGYSNGEIFMQYSIDNGQSWSEPENLTNSPTPGCAPGECDSDHWSSLADRVDDELHIMYINDKDAGSLPQFEGTVTDNPVMYLAVPNPLLAGCDYVAGDCNHNDIPLEQDDILAMIGMYRGSMTPAYTCHCPPHGYNFAPEADPNGNCVAFELYDVVTEIGAYRGTLEASGCPDCPGSRR